MHGETPVSHGPPCTIHCVDSTLRHIGGHAHDARRAAFSRPPRTSRAYPRDTIPGCALTLTERIHYAPRTPHLGHLLCDANLPRNLAHPVQSIPVCSGPYGIGIYPFRMRSLVQFRARILSSPGPRAN